MAVIDINEIKFEIKPCPRCGATATMCGAGIYGARYDGRFGYEAYCIECDNPDCFEWTGLVPSPEHAIDSWEWRCKHKHV